MVEKWHTDVGGCEHDWEQLYPQQDEDGGNLPIIPTGVTDVFYCRRCLEIRRVRG